jgi:hypothetical protein
MLPILVRKFLIEHPGLLVRVEGDFSLSNKQIEDSSIDLVGYAKHQIEEMLVAKMIENGALLIGTTDKGCETVVEGCAYVVNMEEYIRNYITEKIENMAKQIELTKDTMCAHDQHEIKNYPRPWYKAKPELPKGTVLTVKETWSNFYGTYHRCVTPDGEYDIPVENAKEVVPTVGELEETCASEVCRYRGNGVCTFRKGEYCPMYEPNAEEIARMRMERRPGNE